MNPSAGSEFVGSYCVSQNVHEYALNVSNCIRDYEKHGESLALQ